MSATGPSCFPSATGPSHSGCNLNDQVQVVRWVTARSFDGYMWQTLERKARFIHEVMSPIIESRLAAKLEKVAERLAADAPNLEQPGAALIAHYLDFDRLPVDERWSRKHADTQWRLCKRFAAPVISAVTCQDISVGVAIWMWPEQADNDHRFYSVTLLGGCYNYSGNCGNENGKTSNSGS